jgi:small multidrug resistance family-3 protein
LVNFAPLFPSLAARAAILKALGLFVLAGLFEIGGGYLVWQWLKADKPAWWGGLGAVLLVLYGIVATWQITSFGKTYAVYGALFIVMSIAWAWYFDGFKPDRLDVIGGLVVMAGVGAILFWPRS